MNHDRLIFVQRNNNSIYNKSFRNQKKGRINDGLTINICKIDYLCCSISVLILRYFFEISYKGTNYHGWQIQQNANSVQQVVQEKLKLLLNKNIDIVGSGRTDTGVHAKTQFFHADFHSELNCSDFRYHLNAVLPYDICVRSIRPVTKDAHARFDAISRSYRYFILNEKDPFRIGEAYIYHKELNMDRLKVASELLVGKYNFESFSKVKTQVNNFICEVHTAKWSGSEHDAVFEIKANRFLRGMVRAIVGTLLLINEGKMEPGQITEIISGRDRKLAGRSVPADGLFLWAVDYPDQIFIKQD